MQPIQDAAASLNDWNMEQTLADGSKAVLPRNREEARRYLLNLLDHREFQLTVFMARKYFFNAIIMIEDLNFFMTSVGLAIKNGHSDAIQN